MRLFLLSVILSFSSILAAEEKKELNSQDFLNIVRHPPGRKCWALMNGEVIHRRRGRETVKAPLYLAIRFTPERTLAEVIIDNSEGYYVGQAYKADKDATSIIPVNSSPDAKSSLLADFGLRPQDLTMTFLFWKMLDELERNSVKGAECRVFMLESPKQNEKVKVYISAEYYFPLKVEWFRKDDPPDSRPYRTLEVSSFRKEDDFWLISSLVLYGPGWKSKIDFEDTKAGFTKDGIPPGLFRKIPADKTVNAAVKKD